MPRLAQAARRGKMAKFTSAEVRKVSQRLKRARDRDHPAHFLIGAGCSISAGIPSATDLIKTIHAEYADECASLDKDSLHSYGACMALLSINERRDLIRPYLENAKVNWGTIALAQLIVEGFVERVLTVNFDLVLENACGLLGLQPAVYDFGVAPANDPAMVVSPAIVHLHGQSYGLVLLNTDEETQKHREKLQPILVDSLRSAPLLVIGYSGSADGIFQTLLKEFEGREPFYWVSYDEEPASHIHPFAARNHFQFIGGADFDRFMIELAQSLGCWPPDLFTNPLGHLLDELSPVVPYPTMDSEGAIDLLRELRCKLESLMKRSNEQDQPALSLQQLYMKGDFEGAATLFSSRLSQGELSKVERDIAYSSFNSWGLSLQRRAKRATTEVALRLFEEAADKYRAALAIKPDGLEALHNWGLAQEEQSKLVNKTQAAQLLAEAEKNYRSVLAIKPDDHLALEGLGSIFLNQSRSANDEEAIALLLKADEKFNAALAIKADLPSTLDNWSASLLEQAKRAKGKKATRLLAEAEKKMKAAMRLDPAKTYNMACLAALRRDESKCHENLSKAEQSGTLPHVEVVSADPDLDFVSDKLWFRELMDRLRSKANL
jgi:tetratricopeptide (TPR) repeat protein